MKEITWCEMVTRYATVCDKIVLFWAYFGTILVSVMRPAFALGMGKVVDGVGETVAKGNKSGISDEGFGNLGMAVVFMVGLGLVTGLF